MATVARAKGATQVAATGPATGRVKGAVQVKGAAAAGGFQAAWAARSTVTLGAGVR